MEVTQWFFVAGCICGALLIGFVIGMFFVGYLINEPEEVVPELPNRSPRKRLDFYVKDDLPDCDCKDVNQCDTWCKLKQRFYENPPEDEM